MFYHLENLVVLNAWGWCNDFDYFKQAISALSKGFIPDFGLKNRFSANRQRCLEYPC